jgi:hypothetical protein
MWAKHYLGFFLNYLRFFNLASKDDIKQIHLILICSSFATTIAIFLHTLRFKGYLNPKVSLAAYVVSYMSTFIGYAMIFHVFFRYPSLSALVMVGLLVNLHHYRTFDVFQGLLCIGALFVSRDIFQMASE